MQGHTAEYLYVHIVPCRTARSLEHAVCAGRTRIAGRRTLGIAPAGRCRCRSQQLAGFSSSTRAACLGTTSAPSCVARCAPGRVQGSRASMARLSVQLVPWPSARPPSGCPLGCAPAAPASRPLGMSSCSSYACARIQLSAICALSSRTSPTWPVRVSVPGLHAGANSVCVCVCVCMLALVHAHICTQAQTCASAQAQALTGWPMLFALTHSTRAHMPDYSPVRLAHARLLTCPAGPC